MLTTSVYERCEQILVHDIVLPKNLLVLGPNPPHIVLEVAFQTITVNLARAGKALPSRASIVHATEGMAVNNGSAVSRQTSFRVGMPPPLSRTPLRSGVHPVPD